MSLLDDVSIVVTPNAYNVGTLYAVIPTPTLGPELVPDGNFTNQAAVDYWQIASSRATKSLEDGFMRLTYDVAVGSALYKNSLATVGKNYLVTFRAKGTANSKFVAIGDNSSLGNNPLNPVLTSDWQDYKFIVPLSTGITFRFYLGAAQIGDTLDITNISVKEWTGADMDVTRATAATRVDEDGLVNYAEIIGGEEIEDGDFPSGTTEWTVSDGTVSFDNGATFDIDSKIYQLDALVTGKIYKATYEITDNVGGMTLRFYNGGSYFHVDDSVGVHTVYFTALPSNTRFYINTQTGTSLVLKNISLKEVTRDNVPRIDYTGGGCPHILAEPMRTNEITYSEDFSDSSWFKANTTISSYSTTSPSGETNASTIVSTSGTSEQYIDVGSLSVTSGEDYTMSCFVKKKDYDFFLIRFTGAGGAFTAGDVFFNINNGTLGTVSSGFSGTITDFGNGWYKCSATTTAASTTGSGKVRLQLASSDNIYTIAGDGSSGTFVWGSQMEEGSYATSYIPTSGSTVTRNQDQFTRDGIGSLINSTEGVLFAEIAALADNLTRRRITLSDGTTNNRINLYFENVSNTIKAFIKGSGGNDTMVYSSSDTTQFHKIAVSYKDGGSSLWVNGLEVDTSFSTFNLSNLSDLDFSQAGGSETFYGKVRQLQVYDTALTDTQLAALTS